MNALGDGSVLGTTIMGIILFLGPIAGPLFFWSRGTFNRFAIPRRIFQYILVACLIPGFWLVIVYGTDSLKLENMNIPVIIITIASFLLAIGTLYMFAVGLLHALEQFGKKEK